MTHPSPAARTPSRVWSRLRLAGVLAGLLGALFLLGALPLDRFVEAGRGWIEARGALGPVIFGAIYVVAVVLALPGSVLTIAAGAIFGLATGTIVVSLASTTGVALCFLIGRHLARERVRRRIESSPKLRAVDAAIREGGWRIVAMLRLSPAVPFNVQNYLYGVTSIRFWPCVLTSWIAMLPGTFMYVYLAYAGIATVGGGARERTTGEWILLAVGAVLTIAVTVYITKLARRKLAEQTGVEDGAEEGAMHERKGAAAPSGPSPATAIATLLLGLAILVGGAGCKWGGWLHLGPPARELDESYADGSAAGATYDHAAFDRIASRYVDGDGWVDYDRLAASADDRAALRAYVDGLAAAPFDDLGRDEKLALLINAYNACTLQLILDHHPVASIKDIPADERWSAKRWTIAGRTLALDDIEHDEIRGHFREPRIHFALVCAAVGCPILRDEAYTGARLEAQLADQTAYVHAHDRWLRYDADAGVLHLTKLYDWYGDDFRQVAGSVLAYVADQVPAVRSAIDAGAPPTIEWLDYDWSLNSTANRP